MTHKLAIEDGPTESTTTARPRLQDAAAEADWVDIALVADPETAGVETGPPTARDRAD